MTNDKIDELLTGKEPEDKQSTSREFKPTFNVREEFVLWVQKQFPQLKKHSKKNVQYDALEARRDEVYQAALGAVNHGVTSTEACATAKLRTGWEEFDRGFGKSGKPEDRAKSLEAFVKALSDLSISLGGDKHYTEAGTRLSGTSYGDSWYKKNNAFVYRVGDEKSKDAKYLVFNKEQDFAAEGPILIGELTGLSNWEVEKLKKIVSKFKGPETKFIEQVDKEVPEDGAYTYSSYGSSYGENYGYGSHRSFPEEDFPEESAASWLARDLGGKK